MPDHDATWIRLSEITAVGNKSMIEGAPDGCWVQLRSGSAVMVPRHEADVVMNAVRDVALLEDGSRLATWVTFDAAEPEYR